MKKKTMEKSTSQRKHASIFLNHINHLTKSISLHHPIPLADGKGGSNCCRERYGGEKKEVN